jgi:nitroreductase
MDALDAIKKRCSIREFKEKPIPEEIIKEIVNAGRLAPTGRGEEPWEFIIIREKEIRQRIAQIAKTNGSFIAQVPVCIAVFCKPTKYYLEDGSVATENILISATSFGIGSCWVAGDKKPYCEEIRKILNVPEGYKLVSLIALGYPLKKPVPKQKRKLDDVLHWEKF